MFKVVCINNGVIINSHGNPSNAPELKELETYSVIRIAENELGGIAYILKEVALNPMDWVGYNAKRFIPLSEIDEREMIREHKTVTNQ